MSNAAVINATNASGQTAGSPITIETGGDVVLKLYGTGSGAWNLTAAFAPVVDGVTGAPITLTINEQTPAAKTSITKTGATQWVGWIMQANGIWEASGLVEGYTGDEALSDHIGTFPSVAALPTKAIKTGTRASVNGTDYRWGGVAVGWEDAARNANQASFGNRCVWDGDSITDGNGGVQTMAAILNGKMIVVQNCAVAGQKISDMLSRISDTLSYSPDVVWLMAGSNDAIQSTPLSEFSSNLIAYIKAVQTAKAQLILSLIPPQSSGGNLNAQKINNCIRIIATKYGIPLCDPWELYRANDGTWVAGASEDGIHPLPFVLQDAAVSANTQLSGFLNSMPSVYPSLAQPDGGLRANNLFLTGAAGLADGVNTPPGSTNTLTAATLPKLGNVQKFDWTSYAGDSDALIFGGSVSAGDRVLFVSRIKFDPKSNANAKIEIKLIGDYGAKTHGFVFAGAPVNFTKAFEGVIASEFVSAPGSTTFDAYLMMQRKSGGVLTASVEFSQMQFYNLTALGLA